MGAYGTWTELTGEEQPRHETCWRMDHGNGEQTVVTVRRVATVHVVEAIDLDTKRTFPAMQVGVTRTAEEAMAVARRWMDENEDGVHPGGVLQRLRGGR